MFDVIGLRMVPLPEIELKMRLTVAPHRSFVLCAGEDMFYIWKRNGLESPVYTVFFKKSPASIDALCKGINCFCFSSDSKVAVVAYVCSDGVRFSLFDSKVFILDLHTGSYKLVNLQLYVHQPFKVVLHP